MTYPPAPWNMHGQLWLSLFRVRDGDHSEREPGVYGAALVSYEQPSPLTYSELLVARPVKAAGGRRVNITDIWVDSADSRDGGRDLWAIPKGLCDFRRQTTGDRVQRTAWSTSLDGVPIASARFTDVSRNAPRTPFKGSTWQERPDAETGVGPGGRGRTDGQRQGAALPRLLGVQRVGAACLAGRQAIPRVVPDV